jgi:hypothetical protein
MEIASFDSQSEAQQVLDAVVKMTYTAYVGMERKGSRGFVNDEEEVVSLPWAYGEPNNAGNNENCVIVSEKFNGYNDVRCDNIVNFVCQKSQ